MAKQSRFIILMVLCTFVLLVSTACGGAFTNVDPVVSSVTEATVQHTIQYVDGFNEGPLYQFTLTLPEDWVGNIATRSEGNVVYFDAVESNGLLFYIEALSEAQFWKQSSYPGEYTNIATTPDNTFFIYHLPIDAYYSGLPVETFEALSADVPAVISTFTVAAAQ